MSVRSFDGSSRINLSIGGIGAICNGAHSVIAIGKPAAINAPRAYLGIQTASSLMSGFAHQDGSKLATFTDGPFADADATPVVDTWQILGMGKAAGTTSPHYHVKPLGSGSWDHATAGGTLANNATSPTEFEIGAFRNNSFSSGYSGLIACVAVYDTELSQANFESVQTTPSTQQLATLGAVALWDLNQAATTTDVLDLIGSADETSVTGTSVTGGDDPPGWTFGLGGGETGAGGSTVRPGRHRGRYPARDADWF
jgi:hypothetical protein